MVRRLRTYSPVQELGEAIALGMTCFRLDPRSGCSGLACYDFNFASLAASILAVSRTGTMSAVPAGMMGQSPIRICVASLASTTTTWRLRIASQSAVGPDLGNLYTESGQTLQGSFSAGWLAGRLVLGCIEAKFCK